jgi:hypothetical protein
MSSSQKKEAPMKYLAILALLLTLSVAAVSAEENTVKMTFSGTSVAGAANLVQPNTSTDEDNFAGSGTLGSFTVHNIRALPSSPTPSTTCSGSNLLFFSESAGGSIFRFQDGSLLLLTLTEGSDCINLSSGEAHCTLTFKVTGGTGRFKNASGTLRMTETVLPPVLSDTMSNPVLSGAKGEFAGTISGVEPDQEHQDEQQ